MKVLSNDVFVFDSTARASSWKAASDLNGVVSGKLIGSLSIRADKKASLSQALPIVHVLAGWRSV